MVPQETGSGLSQILQDLVIQILVMLQSLTLGEKNLFAGASR